MCRRTASRKEAGNPFAVNAAHDGVAFVQGEVAQAQVMHQTSHRRALTAGRSMRAPSQMHATQAAHLL